MLPLPPHLPPVALSVLAATLAGTSRLVNTPHVPSLYVLVPAPSMYGP